MEIFVDCGIFEFIAFAGLVALARIIFRRHLVAVAWLVLSVALPAATLLVATGALGRALAALGLLGSAVNVALLTEHLPGGNSKSADEGR
jgi:hypothetical protein